MGTNQNESALFAGLSSVMGRGPMDPAGALHLDNGFRCGNAEGAKARALHKVPIFRYLFANNKPGAINGATHGEDLQHVFGNGKSGLSKLFQESWATFAEDPVNGLSKLGWPKYDAQGDRRTSTYLV
jgi:carboxylesterase type B